MKRREDQERGKRKGKLRGKGQEERREETSREMICKRRGKIVSLE